MTQSDNACARLSLSFCKAEPCWVPPDGSTTHQHSARPGAVEPGQTRAARGVLVGGSIPTMSSLPARNRASGGPPICCHHNKEGTGMARGRKGCPPCLVMSLQSLSLHYAVGCHHSSYLCPGTQRSQLVPSPGHLPSPSASPPLPLPHCHHQTRRAPHPLAHPGCPPAAQSSCPSARSCASAPVGSGTEKHFGLLSASMAMSPGILHCWRPA